ncbi:MAG: hypothetical protein NT164_02485 [Verrucomicrobiae bacterium]|nr:hypothetical protein [Verrucomicrobiae bacterium]
MTVTKPISLLKTPSSVDQKPVLFRLSKRELEEVHTALTHYPQQYHPATDAQSPSDRTSENSSQKSSSASPSDSLDKTKKSEGQQFKSVVTGQEKKNPLTSKRFYHEKEEPVDYSNSDSDQNNDSLCHDLDHLPSASSLAGGATALLSQVKSLFQPYRPSILLDDIKVDVAKVDGSSALVDVAKVDGSSALVDVAKVDGSSALVDVAKVDGSSALVDDAGDDTDFNGTQYERAHEATRKMAEGEENNATMVKPGITRAEIAPVTGSAGSSGADLSDPVAAALRVTHLLDELTAAVSRLRLDSSDGKEMTIQLRREVLPETNIHIVSTSKQMEVSFFTSNAASNLLLNTHLTTLQNHLNSLCPGQVVNVQTQLTPSSGSSQMGSEQEHSHDDLASFDQGNRGNEAREE